MPAAGQGEDSPHSECSEHAVTVGCTAAQLQRDVMRNYDKSGQIAAVISDKRRQAHSPALTGPADPRPICAVAVPK